MSSLDHQNLRSTSEQSSLSTLLGDILDKDVSSLKGNGVAKPGQSDAPSKYDQSILSGSIIERDSKEDPGRLFNSKDPQVPILHEKPHHRVMIYLAAQGNTIKEISELTGFTTVMVSNTLKQPWAEKQITDIIAESGKTKVELVLKGAALRAVERLIQEVDNPEGTAATRITAADKVLDRVWGKANQPMTIQDGKNLDDMSDAEIAAELARIKSNRN